jgi:hypothetical protein
MFPSLRNASNRSRLIWVSILAALVLFGVAWLIVYFSSGAQDPISPIWIVALQAITGVLATLSGSAVVALLFGVFVSREEELDQVTCVDPQRTRRLHADALSRTDFWFHDGHLARWVRTSALTKFTSDLAQGGTKVIKVLILDPHNEQMLAAYADYCRQIGYREKRFGSAQSTLEEVLATIIRLHIARDQQSKLNVEIYFRSHLSHSRVDISERFAFRTLIRPDASAVVYSRPESGSGVSFFHALLDEFDQKLEIATRYDMSTTSGLKHKTMTVGSVRDYLVSAGLPGFQDDALISGVIARVRADRNPHL